jgi:hypothetical protein
VATSSYTAISTTLTDVTRGDLECAIAELRRARLALADAHHVIESVEAP